MMEKARIIKLSWENKQKEPSVNKVHLDPRSVSCCLVNESLITARGCSPQGLLHLSRSAATTGACHTGKRTEENVRARAEKREQGKKSRRHVNSHVVSDRPCRMNACKKGAPCCLAIPHCASKFVNTDGDHAVSLLGVSISDKESGAVGFSAVS
ncbi:hypothetical protein DMN91_002874 [Ooceraea biroi]|uniref:Uncharacterized protein n=1 Tax=Ooceraea biroi TaxID=2015173 RepID=A0A3L8DWE7_OOCBI|nr:hypothetical protein DMN91_002874 [Ooceraea biroi]